MTPALVSVIQASLSQKSNKHFHKSIFKVGQGVSEFWQVPNELAQFQPLVILLAPLHPTFYADAGTICVF